MVLDENKNCPMLDEDNLCRIQRDYGEEFLSETCVTYPRWTYNFGDFYERALLLTCPLVASKVLLQREPIEFEHIEVPKIIHDNLGRIKSHYTNVPVELWSQIIDIQSAAISILQERALTIDQRLIVLGFFLDRMDELIQTNDIEGIRKLTEIYRSKDFVLQQAPIFAKIINFNVNDYMKLIFNLFEALYSGQNNFKIKDAYFIDSVIKVFKIRTDENNQIEISELVKTYNELAEFRENFIQYNSTVFENYLVNEFFLNIYPWKFSESVTYNYSLFVTIYKMLEFISLANSVENLIIKGNGKIDKTELVSIIILIVNNIDHNNKYLGKIYEYLKDKDDIVTIMESLLQG